MFKLLFFYFKSLISFKEGWRWTEIELTDGSFLCGYTKGLDSLIKDTK